MTDARAAPSSAPREALRGRHAQVGQALEEGAGGSPSRRAGEQQRQARAARVAEPRCCSAETEADAGGARTFVHCARMAAAGPCLP